MDEAMGKLIEWLADEMISSLIPKTVVEAASRLLLAAWICFSLYNLAALVRFGVVYRLAKRESAWIAFADAPGWFLLWSGVYALPLFAAALCGAAWIARRRQAERDTLRRFVDGGDPAPLVRRLQRDPEKREPASDRILLEQGDRAGRCEEKSSRPEARGAQSHACG